MKNKKQVGKALGRIASGLFVVTAKCEDKEDAVLASWVNQCAFDPPAVTIALATLRQARLLVEGAGAFIVNVLPKDDAGRRPCSIRRRNCRRKNSQRGRPLNPCPG